ncbi:long-chain-fatty-acid--CoA ligase ACSBG2-like [Diretmus argenteus]
MSDQDSIISNEVSLMDGDTESIPTQKAQTPVSSKPWQNGTRSSLLVNGSDSDSGEDKAQESQESPAEPQKTSGSPGPESPAEPQKTSGSPGPESPAEPQKMSGSPGPESPAEPQKTSGPPGTESPAEPQKTSGPPGTESPAEPQKTEGPSGGLSGPRGVVLVVVGVDLVVVGVVLGIVGVVLVLVGVVLVPVGAVLVIVGVVLVPVGAVLVIVGVVLVLVGVVLVIVGVDLVIVGVVLVLVGVDLVIVGVVLVLVGVDLVVVGVDLVVVGVVLVIVGVVLVLVGVGLVIVGVVLVIVGVVLVLVGLVLVIVDVVLRPGPSGGGPGPSGGGPGHKPKAIPLPKAVALAPADQLWSTARDQAVKLRMEGSGVGSETPMTIHQIFLEAVEGYGDHPALASKKEGQWVTLTWRQYYEQCRAAAKSFLKLGLERYHGVGILGFNSPEWFISDVGCILAGGLAAGIYATNSPEACQYVAANCEANVLVVENHKQLVKILQVKDQLPHLKAIVQYSDELQQKLPNLYTWAEFMKLGEDIPDEQLNAVIDSLRANECCSLIYTSGTTGNPKGVMLSHDNITWLTQAAGVRVGVTLAEEVIVSYLPLSHVAAQVNDMWLIMKFAGTTYFADPDALKGSLGTTLKEVRPTTFLGVPRVWEKMQEKMKAAGAKASPMRKRVADWAKSIGLQYNYSAMKGEHAVPWGFMLANNLVFKKVRSLLGLDRCRLCFTGAAPITKDTLEYFMSLNIPLFELYGMSESSGPHTISTDSSFRILSCGKVMPGCKTKLDNPDAEDNGEICFWGRHIFMGYLNMPDKTEEAVDQDGWLHSGDLGRHDENNFLYITGRIKELIITAGGENIPPVPIEDAIKAETPIISNAMLLGDKLKFLSVLLTLKCVLDESGEPTDELSPEAVDYCQQQGVTATKVSDIIANKEPAIYRAIQEGMERVNARATSNAQKIQKWVILDQDFSITGGELGPTMKLRRPVVVKMYQEKINEMYGVAPQTQ